MVHESRRPRTIASSASQCERHRVADGDRLCEEAGLVDDRGEILDAGAVDATASPIEPRYSMLETMPVKPRP